MLFVKVAKTITRRVRRNDHQVQRRISVYFVLTEMLGKKLTKLDADCVKHLRLCIGVGAGRAWLLATQSQGILKITVKTMRYVDHFGWRKARCSATQPIRVCYFMKPMARIYAEFAINCPAPVKLRETRIWV